MVCQFAVIHDLVELYAGDTNVYGPEEHHETKEEREHEALHKLSKEFSHLPWLTDMLTKYEAQDTPEALYVRSIDKFVALVFDYVDEGQYYREHKLTRERFLKDIQRPRKKAMGHPGAFEYHEEAMRKILSRTGFFHEDDEKTTK